MAEIPNRFDDNPCEPFPPIPAPAAKAPLPPVWQDEILKRIGELSREPKILRAALRKLRLEGTDGLLNVIARGGTEPLTKERRQHIEDHWLKEGAKTMLRGAIEACEASLMTGLPISAYWVFGHRETRVAVCQSGQQITLLVMRPYPEGIASQGEARTQWGISMIR